MTPWHIRRARPEDARGLAACIDDAYAVYKDVISDLPDVSAGIDREITDHHVWVATVDDRIVGGLVLIDQANHMVLANVAVSPDQRGTGLGRHFVELAERECAGLGHTQLRLSTHHRMPDNVKLYEHFGWRISGQFGSKINMTKTIPAPQG